MMMMMMIVIIVIIVVIVIMMMNYIMVQCSLAILPLDSLDYTHF